ELTVASARARAAQGVSLQAMIGTYQLALPILWEHLIATVAPHAGVRLELLLRSRGEAIADFLRLLVSADAPLDTVAARAGELGLDLETLRVAVQFRR